ncbi:MAG TPA: ABC-2 transporter permease [Candidatus Erysipelatoclostridium merdavium]|uniref:ABC-2 transporter permease n=1 Tax=Candidatus Erysipelatoclostridium merdavium TaxID=2838566 RepID=A0A9D1XK87_9FIRM|nr:ABC-2 transporter permease [Candidatus Erysipelatoclostridium merdavium]
MKGLLIKDFKLMLNQKKFFILIVLILGATACFLDFDYYFLIGYFMFICSLFTISTISYDEFDNGNAFLFTLPFSRSRYVEEKYCFGILAGTCSWFLSFVITTIIQIINSNNFIFSDWMLSTLVMLPIMFVMLAILIPFQLKYGSENGRIAIIIFLGGGFVVCYLLANLLAQSQINFNALISFINNVDPLIILLIIFAICLAILFVSMKISKRIVLKKEF